MKNIEVFDDSVQPVEVQKIVIKETETKTVENVIFDGTLIDAQTELERAIKNRDNVVAKAEAEVIKWQDIITTLTSEIEKLPARIVPNVEPVEQPVEEPVEQPVEEPVEQPVEEPVTP